MCCIALLPITVESLVNLVHNLSEFYLHSEREDVFFLWLNICALTIFILFSTYTNLPNTSVPVLNRSLSCKNEVLPLNILIRNTVDVLCCRAIATYANCILYLYALYTFTRFTIYICVCILDISV